MELKITILSLALLSMISCKPEEKARAPISKKETVVQKELTLLEKVANAHGLENWKNVNEIQYTFNVDRDGNHFERHWTWKPKTNDVSVVMGKDTIRYTRIGIIDSTLIKTDGGFINDKYWLLAPFNLVWDCESFEYTHEEKATAPISKTAMQKLTIVYGDKGGYTPGDAYDLYFGDDLIIREWVFRKANTEAPSLVTSWENYEDFKGLKIAKTHKKDEGNWTLSFSNISVK
ncbi:hypothetical protein ACFQ1M_10590 [Sungkyunkwania multivorans]|uniref:Uncharacterized protein n=1 Tax=Sungkyunkwania multivorans TaxID=1173618 RepID=A0ABW3D107_9FLAO